MLMDYSKETDIQLIAHHSNIGMNSQCTNFVHYVHHTLTARNYPDSTLQQAAMETEVDKTTNIVMELNKHSAVAIVEQCQRRREYL